MSDFKARIEALFETIFDDVVVECFSELGEEPILVSIRSEDDILSVYEDDLERLSRALATESIDFTEDDDGTPGCCFWSDIKFKIYGAKLE
jgi:hypothetical protein